MMQKSKKMNTPIFDFVKAYAEKQGVRLHMPGHKGQPFVGCEDLDITEIAGADSLYEAEGIIAMSEANAAALFESKATLFSTEGSSQCIRAMFYLAMLHGKSRSNKRSAVAAARNVHKSFISAVTLLDLDVIWLWPEEQVSSVCSCHVSTEQVARVLDEHEEVIAVYLTSPDYLGAQADIKEIAKECHERDVILAVDNAHGAYLKFLEQSEHPLDQGADICCDSAHKTLPVLTGGAYLHVGKNAPEIFAEQAKRAMELFGSTSPSYLTMISLDLCNRYLSEQYAEHLKNTIKLRNQCCAQLEKAGWRIAKSDPLKITIELPSDLSSAELTQKLRDNGIEFEYADPGFIVFMITPENTMHDLDCIAEAIGKNEFAYKDKEHWPAISVQQKMPIRAAMFSVPETVLLENAENRVCRVPTVSCPPAIPIAVPGEIITKELISLFQYYGITKLDVVKE